MPLAERDVAWPGRIQLVAQAQTISAFRDWTPLVGLRIEYSLGVLLGDARRIPEAADAS